MSEKAQPVPNPAHASASPAPTHSPDRTNVPPYRNRLAQLAATINQSPRVHEQFKLAEGIKNSERVQTQRRLAAQINMSEPAAQRQVEESEDLHPRQARLDSSEGATGPNAGRPNRTGLSDTLKSNVENLSGLSLDDVRVHYGSSKPAQLNALAYAQGSEIHVAPGQERHLPHEAWHIVQQKQGRVAAKFQAAGVSINDDPSLELEADAMGARALQRQAFNSRTDAVSNQTVQTVRSGPAPVQRRLTVKNIDYNPVTNQYRHGIIDQATFLTDLRDEINNVARWANYRGQAANVINAVRAAADAADGGSGWHRRDVPGLARKIAYHVIQEYSNLGLPAIAGQRVHLEEAIIRLLAQNIQRDPGPGVAMNRQEEGAYDVLRGIVTDARMSRAKGTASDLPYASLPGALKVGVDTVLTGIRAERAYWQGVGITNLPIEYFLPAPNEEFNVAVRTSGRLTNYQGNHTNKAGWLPTVAAPVSPLNQKQRSIQSHAQPNLKRILYATGGTLAALGGCDFFRTFLRTCLPSQIFRGVFKSSACLWSP